MPPRTRACRGNKADTNACVRLLGNAVVPDAARYAYVYLASGFCSTVPVDIALVKNIYPYPAYGYAPVSPVGSESVVYGVLPLNRSDKPHQHQSCYCLVHPARSKPANASRPLSPRGFGQHQLSHF